MSLKIVNRIIVVALIAAMLAGAYMIVARNNPNGSKQETPSGFFH